MRRDRTALKDELAPCRYSKRGGGKGCDGHCGVYWRDYQHDLIEVESEVDLKPFSKPHTAVPPAPRPWGGIMDSAHRRTSKKSETELDRKRPKDVLPATSSESRLKIDANHLGGKTKLDRKRPEEIGAIPATSSMKSTLGSKRRKSVDADDDGSKARSRRIEIFDETVSVVRGGGYKTDSGEFVVFDMDLLSSGVSACRVLTLADELAGGDKSGGDSRGPPLSLLTLVINGDSFDCAEVLQSKGFNAVVLNMANAFRPGGGVKNGARAQEECLHRRSNLFQHLENPDGIARTKPWSYPLPEFGAVYSPLVCVFRAAADLRYDWLDRPFYTSVISAAAYSNPKTRVAGDDVDAVHVMTDEYTRGTKMKIELILRLAMREGHDAIVLGAFGCGAFKNPPLHMAQLFSEVLTDCGCARFFKLVAFAIIEDHNSLDRSRSDGNIAPFARVLTAGTVHTIEDLIRMSF